jgi:glycosyltransferase involved in cell wall biosynthesis
MRILIDAHLSSDRTDGIGRYLNELIPAMVTIDRENEYVLLLQSGIGPDHPLKDLNAPNLVKKEVPWQGLTLKQHLSTHGLIGALNVDIYHHPHFDVPWFLTVPTVVTIHGMKYIRHPELYRIQVGRRRVLLKRMLMKTMMGHAIKRADRIITVSRSLRDEIVSVFHVNRDDISVVHLGVKAPLMKPGETGESRTMLRKYGVGGRYILSVSEQLPHKNLVRLIEAFHLFCEKNRNEYQLVIAGRAHRDYIEPQRKVKELALEETVVFTGHIANDEISSMYRSADLFVFPSLYEGFGLPVLEAMAHGVPVIVSRQASLPEVVGQAGILVDPCDPGEIARAIEKVLTDPGIAAKFTELGLERVKKFTWEDTARGTVDIYRELHHRFGSRPN